MMLRSKQLFPNSLEKKQKVEIHKTDTYGKSTDVHDR